MTESYDEEFAGDEICDCCGKPMWDCDCEFDEDELEEE